ncbi:SseB family protein, partial [Acinetobacter baumannii]|uniref:SseB family protein n=1 Tax=Acinetobacter baumannii TaxID=470 RepID=UPI0011470634
PEILTLLESKLQAARQGQCSAPELFEELLASQIIVLLDKPIADDGRWDATARPLTLNSPNGFAVMAVFTTHEKAAPWVQQAPPPVHALSVDFAWIVRGLAPPVGLVIN